MIDTNRDALLCDIARLTPLAELERALPAAGNPYTGNASELERVKAQLRQLDEDEAEARREAGRARFAAAMTAYMESFVGEADDRAELDRLRKETIEVANMALAPHTRAKEDAFILRGRVISRRRDEAAAKVHAREAKRAKLVAEFPILADVAPPASCA